MERITPSGTRWVLLLALGLHFLLSLLRFNTFQVGAYVDDAHYVVLAEALATGQGFSLMNYPEPQAELMFPPGWPLLLSPLVALFPGSFLPFKLLSLVLNLASILLAYRLFARRLQRPYLDLLLLLMAIHPALVGSSGMIMSEPAYLFTTLLALNLFDLWMHQSARPLNWFLLPLALAMIAAQLIRSVGLSLLLSVLIYLALLRRYRFLALLALVLVVGLVPQTLLFRQTGGSVVPAAKEHRVFADASLIEKPLHMASTLGTYLRENVISNMVLPVFGPRLSAWLDRLGLGLLFLLLNALLLLVVVVGFVRSLCKFELCDVYVLAYVAAILSFWNPVKGSVQSRFLIPLVPFLLFYLLQGVCALSSLAARRLSHPARLRIGVTVLVVVVLGILFLVRNFQETLNPLSERITDLSAGTVWIREHAPPDAIVMMQDPVPRYLYARRRTVGYPSTVDAETIVGEIGRQRVDYVLVAPPLQSVRSAELDDVSRRLLIFLQKNPECFDLCYQDPEHNVAVYRVREPLVLSSTSFAPDVHHTPLMDELERSRITSASRKLGFVSEHPVLGEVSHLSDIPDVGASWKFVRPLTGISIRTGLFLDSMGETRSL